MITRHDIEQLLKHPVSLESPVLSVYLNIDQSQSQNTNRHFETAFQTMLQALEKEPEPEQLEMLEADAKPVRHFLSAYRPQAKGIVIFSDESEDFFWQREINVDIKNKLVWESGPCIKPLAELVDDYERYTVVLTDKARTRWFTFYMGELEPKGEDFGAEEVRHRTGTATDNSRSQMNMQRKSEHHALHHLKKIANKLEDLLHRQEFDRLILAGPQQITRHLEKLLPRGVQHLVVRHLALSMDSPDQQVLEEISKAAQELEEKNEESLIEDLITVAEKRGQAVLGLEPVLAALPKGQIAKLVYDENLHRKGAQCAHCHSLFTEVPKQCPYCGAAIEQVQDLIERVVERVMDMDGKIESVHLRHPDNLLNRFKQAESVGAFLRFPILD